MSLIPLLSEVASVNIASTCVWLSLCLVSIVLFILSCNGMCPLLHLQMVNVNALVDISVGPQYSRGPFCIDYINMLFL